MRIAIYPGTFDPITYGHLDVIERAARLFDHIIITVAYNPAKSPLFTAEERVQLIREAIAELDTAATLTVEMFDGLLVDFAKSRNAVAIIRGLRAISDFEYELQMALVNRRLYSRVSTVFLMPHERYTYLNSSIVREIASLGGDISHFVPPVVEARIREKLSSQ
ncbi:MAG: pantetheine-phosphate adenylyltransferase [Calditrichaeota bacterium]|nr:MAG: pantetheine-phosphate adenylyltransferase [Calditrichota bacterium]